MSKRVAVITAGGTISAAKQGGGRISPVSGAEWVQDLIWRRTKDVEVSVHEAFQMLSENMHPTHWTRLAARVEEVVRTRKPSGIVITHGTETMAYTAAALSFALEKIPVPVILTGSSVPPNEMYSNAVLNFMHSVQLAHHPEMSAEVGVLFSYFPQDMLGYFSEVETQKHSQPRTVLIRGVRARKAHGNNWTMFQSINVPPLVKMLDTRVTFARQLTLKPRKPATACATYKAPRTKFSTDVTLLPVHPGMEPKVIQSLVDQGYRGIILAGYGDGTMPCSSSYSLESGIRYATRKKCFVGVTSQTLGPATMDAYEGGQLVKDAGAVALQDMTSECALVKLSWLIGNGFKQDEIRKLMPKNMVGEISA